MKKWFLLALVASTSLFADPYPVTGTLLPSKVTQVATQIEGRVLSTAVDVGDFVEQGQELLRIDPMNLENELEAKKALVDLAKNALDHAEVELTRKTNLWEKKEGNIAPSISKKDFDEAVFNQRQKKLLYDQALTELKRAEINLRESVIKAPYKGVITKRFVDAGESVTVIPITPLVEIMDTSTLKLEFSLPQNLLGSVHKGLSVVSKEGICGQIDKIFPLIEPSTRSFKCRVLVDNADQRWMPGCFVNAQIQIE